MDVNEMLVRTINAAKEAREKGFYETADAFDSIAESLLDLLETRSQSERDMRLSETPELDHATD